MKTDSIFYRLFQEFPEFFFELLGNNPDLARNYEFTSQEIKQLAFRIDGLFLPTTDEPNQPFYLVEAQFQADDTLYYRLFAELFLYIKQYRVTNPWRVVVIYPNRRTEIEEFNQFNEIIQSNRVIRIYLDELAETGTQALGVAVLRLIIEGEATAIAQAQSIVERARDELTDEATKNNLIDLITTIIIYKLPDKRREEIEAMFTLGDLKKTKVYQEAFGEGEQVGEQVGEQRGEQRGKQKAKLEAIPELLKEGLTTEQIARALKLPLNIVQEIAQKH